MSSALLNLQTPKLSSLFSISPPQNLSQTQFLSFTKKSFKSLSIPHTLRNESSSFSLAQDDEETVVGDCVVFEEGVFDDPNLLLQQPDNPRTRPEKKNPPIEAEPENLVPEKWNRVQREINITKQERRRLARELEFERNVEKKRLRLRPIGEGGGDNGGVKDYLKLVEDKLEQLKPIVLDNPVFPEAKVEKSDGELSGGEEEGFVSNGRVAPRNPRRDVYGGTLDDIKKLFDSEDYDPSDSNKSKGRTKLFSKEEKLIMNQKDPDLAVATSGKWKPFHTFAASGEFYFAKSLLNYTDDINAPDKNGLTAIHKAILAKKHAIFNLLLRESADPFVLDKDGATLMHYAVWTASSPMIKILLLYKVDINLQDKYGWTPLHLAVQSRRTDTVRLLLMKGADKTLINRDGLAPIDLCLHFGQDIRTYELLKLLKLLPNDGNKKPSF